MLLASTLAACDKKEDPQIADLRNQIAARDKDLTELRAKYLESVKNEALYKGSLDALKPLLEDQLKTSISMCRGATDAEVAARLAKVQQACEATNENIGKVLATPAATPAPARDPNPVPNPKPDPLPVPAPAPGDPKPLTPSDPPPADGSIPNQQSMEQTVLLAGAFLACEYYSAGTCEAVIAAVGLKLGMSAGEVKAESKNAYQTLQARVDQSGIALPSPTGGEPIILHSDAIGQVARANKAFNALSLADRVNPCKAIEPYRQVDSIRPFIERLSNPLSFQSPEQKMNAVRFAREIDLGFASLLEKIPVGGKGLSCR